MSNRGGTALLAAVFVFVLAIVCIVVLLEAIT